MVRPFAYKAGGAYRPSGHGAVATPYRSAKARGDQHSELKATEALSGLFKSFKESHITFEENVI